MFLIWTRMIALIIFNPYLRDNTIARKYPCSYGIVEERVIEYSCYIRRKVEQRCERCDNRLVGELYRAYRDWICPHLIKKGNRIAEPKRRLEIAMVLFNRSDRCSGVFRHGLIDKFRRKQVCEAANEITHRPTVYYDGISVIWVDNMQPRGNSRRVSKICVQVII